MITSRQNPLIKQLRQLQRKKYRRQTGLYFIEGLRVVLTAIEQNAPIHTIVYAPDLLTSQPAFDMIAQAETNGLTCTPITADLFRTISTRDNPRGLGAILHANPTPLDQLTVHPHDIWVALFEAANPGNIGTVLRTMDAMGAAGLLLIGQQATEPFQTDVAKASMGALFTLPVTTLPNWSTAATWAQQQNLHLVATSAHAPHQFWQTDPSPYRYPALLLIGSERHGLPPAIQDSAHTAVTIPMHGHSTSLNAAVATALILYELRRQAP
ncbi:MAG TPA: RNA methyltransferase [Anaerolineae bacterium]|nr:RNA methyltransferase [Anaerolineae bacterium]